ncbi:MAG: hypothetical protein IJ774_07415 [Selenomonadaceae bacterium]|nr:hypothetical protein [Selenomonadaceae bacterium]
MSTSIRVTAEMSVADFNLRDGGHVGYVAQKFVALKEVEFLCRKFTA